MLVQISLLLGSMAATYGLLWMRRSYKRKQAGAMSDKDLTKAVIDKKLRLYDLPEDKREMVEKQLNVLIAGRSVMPRFVAEVYK